MQNLHAYNEPRAPYTPFIKAFQAVHGTRAAASHLRAGGVTLAGAVRLLATNPKSRTL